MEPKKESPLLPQTSLELLNNKHIKLKRLREININELSNDELENIASDNQAVSTATIMKLAKAQLLQFKSKNADVISTAAIRLGLQSGLSSEVNQDLELAMLLQAAAEKVANRKFTSARKLLNRCDRFASKNGSPLQRIAYYFSESLTEKIDRDTGTFSSNDVGEKSRKAWDLDQAKIHLEPNIIECQQEQPFRLESQFAICQPILDSVASAKKVHLIDFGIDNGSQWTLVMQSLATRHDYPLEHLKITAVGTCKEMLEVTGKWLSNFAKTIDLPFSFEIVISDLKDIKVDFFELNADEVVAVYSGLRLWSLLAWPNYLESVIRVVKGLKPCIVTIREIEASTNSPIFLDRIHQALILFSGMFDAINDCMEHQILFRKMYEEVTFRQKIRNIVTAEGTERIHRHERIAFWRALFARFGMVEIDLSRSSFSQVTWLLGRSSRFRYCTLDSDGKCLIMGWKGTPLMSLSAWKFLN